MNQDSLLLFSKTISSKYSNTKQSQEDPKNFAHINIYFHPIPWCIFDGPGFYSEQSFDYSPWSPYRQSVLKLVGENNLFILENFKLNDPSRFAGGGFNYDVLSKIKRSDISEREGCNMHFYEKEVGRYFGRLEPGNKCHVIRNNKLSYVVSEVSFDNESWTSIDRGYDPITNKLLWGSENGPLYFQKVQDLGTKITNAWTYTRP